MVDLFYGLARDRKVMYYYNGAEPVVGSKATREIIWVARLLKENSEVEETPIQYVDNETPVRLVKNF